MIDIVKTSFSVSETTYQLIQAAAQKSGKSVSEIVRTLFLKIISQNINASPSSRATIEYAVGPNNRKIYVSIPSGMSQALGSLRSWRRLSISALLESAVQFLSLVDGDCDTGEVEPVIINTLLPGKVGEWLWVTKVQLTGWLTLPG